MDSERGPTTPEEAWNDKVVVEVRLMHQGKVFESVKYIPAVELYPDDKVRETLSNALDAAKRHLLNQVERNAEEALDYNKPCPECGSVYPDFGDACDTCAELK